MEFLLHFVLAILILALCILAMAIGVIFRNKSITHCGGASMTFRGEKIRCPACLDKEVPECQRPTNEEFRSCPSPNVNLASIEAKAK
jgi:hypothetical protein